jgi:hypothetical protein
MDWPQGEPAWQRALLLRNRFQWWVGIFGGNTAWVVPSAGIGVVSQIDKNTHPLHIPVTLGAQPKRP